jgi:2-keto-4-pentenoate hydratase/2-oxohepta-3-ene-1,7-dioic acid hydratase in catechol pathway
LGAEPAALVGCAIVSMHIARIRHEGPDGAQARVVVSSAATPGNWADVRTAERLRLERAGANARAARRIAGAVVPGSLTAALEGGEAFLDAARGACAGTCGEAVVAEPVHLLAPIDPPAYRDFMAFEEHIVAASERTGRSVPDVVYELPVSYMGAATAFLGPGDEVPWPAYTERMDYELELGIVVAREARDLEPQEALEHVLGLTVLNDFSARDIQLREMQAGLGPSKGKHFASAVGPWITTLEALDGSLAMEARINGEVWSRGSTAAMMWSIGELLAWASAGETVVPGTLLGSGTVGGGCGLELDRTLSAGDVVELEIESLGVLRNRIGTPAPAGWEPARRERREARGSPAAATS